ncbi:sensor histidine kinase [Chthonobacter albigriseus]|uniref:sensor histidine kinase n=1 Tax=Chthonobacter albigriseus TaxID=1683161 RepID=UPI0015EE8216|nr:ATP-binding protein [Chthonobacter albigriseus]
MADETDRSDREQAGRPAAGGMTPARVLLVLAGLMLAAGHLVYQVPLAAVIGGFGVLVLAVFLSGRPDTVERVTSQPAPAGRAIWPDTSMKVLLDAVDEPCFLADGAGVLRYQNAAAIARFGTARPGDPLSLKLRIPELLSAVDSVGRGGEAQHVPIGERLPTERTYRASVTGLRLPRRDGSLRGKPDFVLVRLHDETELLRMDRMRGDFIANASHELRTPLASLTGFIETLLGPAKDDAVNRERFLSIMLEQAGRMARLIDDLLSLSRIELKAHVRPETRVDLGAIAAQAMELLAPQARAAGATLGLEVAEGPTTIRGDRDELIQVAVNLIENAIKYGRENGRVDITVRPETSADGTVGVGLSVRDDGPGIPPEHLPRLTERFYRVDAARSRQQKGTGLGLAIVKHIVARHRGRLAIRSNPSEGSVFSVWFEAALPG